METSAIVFMVLSWGITLGILGFCIYKLAKSSTSAGLTNHSKDNSN